MNATERNRGSGEVAEAAAAAPIPRRRFLGWCAVLGGGVLPFARTGPGGTPETGPAGARSRELALTEADFYRPHDLAG